MIKTIKKLLLFDQHTCPWWLCFTFDNPIRKLFHQPNKILSNYIKSGDNVLDIGAGMGYFTIPIAKMVSPEGKVTAVDLQPEMLKYLMLRAKKNKIENSIITHICKTNTLGLNDKYDFILAFWMAHEVKNNEVFFNEIYNLLIPSGKFLLVEPKIHTRKKDFDKLLNIAKNAGFGPINSPHIFMSWTTLFKS